MTQQFLSRFTRAGIALSAIAAALAVAAPAQAETIVGLTTTNALLSFDSSAPTNASALNTITGLQGANERILSIDLRPTTGVLYGLSSANKVYSLSTSGAASFVGLVSTPFGSDVLGIDFNPVADLAGLTSLRMVSSTGQNLAFNVNTGATALQTSIQPSISSVAYANNDTNAQTGTALYYVDTAADMLKLATSNFANPTIVNVGALGFNANGVNGFDISGSGAAFAAMTDADTGKSGLYTIDVNTGAATLVGAFGIAGNTAIAPPLLGLAVAAVPEPETYTLMLAGLLGVGFVARRRSRH